MPSPTTITVSYADGTLFHIALRQLGDPLAAAQLAALNDINDPWLTGLTTLQIPTQAADDNGGLPSPGVAI